jgi:hypothetical protein
MAERNSKWGAMDECFIFFLKESVDPTMRSLVKNFVLGNEEYFTKRTKTGELGFAIEKLQNGKFQLKTENLCDHHAVSLYIYQALYLLTDFRENWYQRYVTAGRF